MLPAELHPSLVRFLRFLLFPELFFPNLPPVVKLELSSDFWSEFDTSECIVYTHPSAYGSPPPTSPTHQLLQSQLTSIAARHLSPSLLRRLHVHSCALTLTHRAQSREGDTQMFCFVPAFKGSICYVCGTICCSLWHRKDSAGLRSGVTGHTHPDICSIFTRAYIITLIQEFIF